METNFTPFPVINTARTCLRRFTHADVTAFYQLRSNPVMSKYIARQPYENEEVARKFIHNINGSIDNNEVLYWVLTLQGSNMLIGTLCLWNISTEHHRAEVGYEIHPHYQGQGLIHEALSAVIDYAFKTIGLHSLEAWVHPENTASQKVLMRCNFVREALFKENVFFDGKYVDTAIYSLLAP